MVHHRLRSFRIRQGRILNGVVVLIDIGVEVVFGYLVLVIVFLHGCETRLGFLNFEERLIAQRHDGKAALTHR